MDCPDLEVLVIDYNTDDALWRPREARERLGDRFRVPARVGLDGAKAGALNWALARIQAEAA